MAALAQLAGNPEERFLGACGIHERGDADDAQRATGFGKRLSTYGFDDDALTGAIDGLMADGALGDRLAAMSARIKSTSGTVRAADLIERVAATGEPVIA